MKRRRGSDKQARETKRLHDGKKRELQGCLGLINYIICCIILLVYNMLNAHDKLTVIIHRYRKTIFLQLNYYSF